MAETNKIGRATQPKGVLMLLVTAFIWGVSFVAQSVGMEKIDAFTFSSIRTLLGVCALLPVIFIRDRVNAKNKSRITAQEKRARNKKTLLYGLVLGVVFCAASNFQQFAFDYSTSGKIAFITALYMFFVPVLGLFFRKKVPILTWLCIGVGFVGLYFLCINPTDMGAINKGDVLSLLCSIFFAVQILLIERFAPEVDGIKLSCVQFAVSGVISLVLMFVFETPEIGAIKSALVPLLYSGFMSCGIAYTFQIAGQKYTEATAASLLMCMESVFAVISAALILHERLSGREIRGCVIMFAAIIFSQLSEAIMAKHEKRLAGQTTGTQ